jgi:GT2 family glycosyltransferase
MCIKSDAFKSLGGFDERYFMYLEDVDLTLRAKKMGRAVINPNIAVTHSWERESAKKLKYLFIHLSSARKFLRRRRKKEI